jgi:LCP family protein required for cell wall assembly
VREQHAEAVRFRRALVLLLATLVLPGLAQFIAGNRMLGRIIMQVWAAIVGIVALVLWLVPLDTLAGLAVRPWLLTTFNVLAFGIALGWIALMIDAWRLGDPPRLRRQHRLVMLGATLGLVALIATPFWMAVRYASAAHDAVVTLFPSGNVAAASDGRLNVLLIGADAAEDRVGVRPDSINLVSVDVRTGAPVVIGVPRNLERARFPKGTQAAAEFPTGFTGDGDREEWMINATWTYGEENPELFPDAENPGIEAVKQAVEGTVGLPVHYYVIVDMTGFRELIDAVGGVTIRVKEDLPIGEQGMVLEAGLRKLTGYQALWYARSRESTNDYDRMGRQQCVIGAMARELNPRTVLRNFTELAEASTGMVTTDIPQQQLPQLVDVAWKAKGLPITSLQLTPPLIVPADPDFGVINDEVDAALADARKAAQRTENEATTDDDTTEDAGRDGAADGEAAEPAEPTDQPAPTEAAGSNPDESNSDETTEGAAAEPAVEIGDICSYE